MAAAAFIATGNEVVNAVAPDGAGHPAAVLLPLTLTQALNFGGTSFLAAIQTVTSSTALVDSGLDTPVLEAGATYSIDAYLSVTNGASGGLKMTPSSATGVATATLFCADTWLYDATTLAGQGNITALSGNFCAYTGVVTAVLIRGLITVNAAGFFGITFAQNVSNATGTSLNPGSWLKVQRIS